MGAIKEINIKITGQVPDDYRDKDYEVLIAKLTLVCAEYDLDLNEE